MSKSFSELRQDFRRQQLEYIHTELDAGFTFAEVAKTELRLGNKDRAARNLDFARQALSECQRRIAQAESEKQVESENIAKPREAAEPHPFEEALEAARQKLGALTDLIGSIEPATKQ